MAVTGWAVHLSSSYRTPNMCANCCGPREQELKAVATEKIGNIRRTLTMSFPYCNDCAHRVKSEKIRAALVICFACAAGAGLTLAAWMGDELVDLAILMMVALPIAIGFSTALAFLTRPAAPTAPHTARGEAVILRGTSGTVLCTNARFAELLQQANGTGALVPEKHHWTTELWALSAASLCAILILLLWVRDGVRHNPGEAPILGTDSHPAAPARAPAPKPKKR